MLVVAQRACRLQTRCRREGLSSTDQHLDCSLPCLAGGHREKVKLDNPFFEKPIVHSLYEYPARHWELDGQGQPTQRMIKAGRQAKFITPIPKFRKRKDSAIQQLSPIFGDGAGLSNREQRYDPTGIINKLRPLIDQWRLLPNPSDWLVSPETTRLLQHWRYHQFNNHRPFFCQVRLSKPPSGLLRWPPSQQRQTLPRIPRQSQQRCQSRVYSLGPSVGHGCGQNHHW